MASTQIKWAGAVEQNDGTTAPELALGPPNVDAFSVFFHQQVTYGQWQAGIGYDGLADLLGAATFGDAVTPELLARANVIAFEQNGTSPALSGGWESCVWDFTDSHGTLTVAWSEATVDARPGGIPVPRDSHVVANGSISGAAYAAYFGIPQFKVSGQQVISFLLFAMDGAVDPADPALQITLRGSEQSATDPGSTPDPDAIGVLRAAPADVADPIRREFLRPLGLGGHTFFWDDTFTQGAWSHPDVPLLIFADNLLGGAPVTYGGGPLGTGEPVQLVYWGTWWTTPAGSQRQQLFDARVQALLASPYFSQLDQYGIAAPRWRGSTIVTNPPAPQAFNTQAQTKQAQNLIENMIDNGTFPDPDDGRIAFVILMPQGFTQSVGANGAHVFDHTYEFPFDDDDFWAAWIRYFGPEVTPGEDPESTVQTVSHELVEMLTDPKGDAWNAGAAGEISDAGQTPPPGPGAPAGVKQTAWVNGVHVQSYWSNRHGATIIPIDRDYTARVSARTAVLTESVVDSGTFRPTPGELALCGTVPQCCIPDRDYTWQVRGRDERAVLRVETTRYRTPVVQWTVEGAAVSGSNTVTLNLGQVQTFTGRDPVFAPGEIHVQYSVTAAGLELSTTATAANFDLHVGCQVTDGSITGNVKVNVVATPAITVSFVGAEVVLEGAYVSAHEACGDAARAFFTSVPGLSHTPLPGEPRELDPGVIAALPAYARVALFRQARQALALTRLAAAVLPAEAATAYLQATKVRLPILQIPLAAQASE